MSFFPEFAKHKPAAAEADQSGEPQLNGHCLDRVDFTPRENTALTPVDNSDAGVLRQISANEQFARSTVARLVEQVRDLSPENQQMLLAGFASHWTGQGNELYDHVRSAIAGAGDRKSFA